MILTQICYGKIKEGCRSGIWRKVSGWERMNGLSENKSLFLNFKLREKCQEEDLKATLSYPCCNALAAHSSHWAPKHPELTIPCSVSCICGADSASSLSLFLIGNICKWEFLKRVVTGMDGAMSGSTSYKEWIQLLSCSPGERRWRGKQLGCLQALKELLLTIRMDCSMLFQRE